MGRTTWPPKYLWLHEYALAKPDAVTRKVPIHIRMAPDVLEFFKKGGPGYQTRINRVLEQYVNWQQR